MSKKIDPTERALDAYFQLDTDQRATFHMAVKHVDRFASQLGHSAAEPAPPRGRPRGAKNKPKAGTAPTAQELDLRHNNAAAEAGL